MEGRADADYERCVDICTKASLHEMILPTLLAIITPVVTGLILGYNGSADRFHGDRIPDGDLHGQCRRCVG